MNIRKPIWSSVILVVIITLFSYSCQRSGAGSDKNPNILFIMSDDHGYQAISAYGYGLNHTPNIDRLAEEGVIFTNGCVNNSICAPSRAAMLTGKHSYKNGKVDNVLPFNWDQDNFAKQLQSSGYQTALIGKIHLNGLPQGFDYSNVLPGQGQYYNPDFIENGEKKKYHGYCTQITTDIALDWLQNKRDREKPFLLLYHQKAPHRTWMPEKKYLDLFDDKTLTPPNNFFDNYDKRPVAAAHEMGIFEHMDLVYDLKMLDEDEEIQTQYRKYAQNMYNRMDDEQRADWDAHYKPLIEEFKALGLEGKELAVWKFNRYMRDYLATVQSVDDGVGQVLDYLDEAGLTDNTVVVYTSDQGFYLGEHGWFDKRFMYEESFKTPILIRYPNEVKAGQTITELVQNIDFAPTFLDYAGIDIPLEIQGESFRKLVNGKSSKWRDAVYYTYYEYPGEHNVERHHGIRTDRYKLIHFYYDSDTWEMYDLQEDPSEMNNLYDNPDYSEIQKDLHKQLIELRVKYEDSDELDQEHLDRFLKNMNLN